DTSNYVHQYYPFSKLFLVLQSKSTATASI
ncbi:hypothetical protein AC249_AIPGENE25011, partial [Exaiptasia diaphana]